MECTGEEERTLQEFGFVHGELGSKFEALGFFLGDELEEVCVSGALGMVSDVEPSLGEKRRRTFLLA